jgi:hypothetical protein
MAMLNGLSGNLWKDVEEKLGKLFVFPQSGFTFPIGRSLVRCRSQYSAKSSDLLCQFTLQPLSAADVSGKTPRHRGNGKANFACTANFLGGSSLSSKQPTQRTVAYF